MSQPFHSYPWYSADWRESETRFRLSIAERGLYRELLDWTYREGSLPADERMLAKIADVPPDEFKALWPAVQPCFQAGADGRLTHPKVSAILQQLGQYREKRKSAGISGAAARWNRARSGENGKRIVEPCASDGKRMRSTWPSTSSTTSTTTEREAAVPAASAQARRAPARFAAPTVEDIATYAAAQHLQVDAAGFHDFYAAKGWMIGKGQMKDWRAAVRNWCRRDMEHATNGHRSPAAATARPAAALNSYAGPTLEVPEEVAP